MSGPRKKPRKPIKAEHDQRVQAALEMLNAGKSDGEIKKAVAEQFGLSPRSVERYLRRAREQVVAATGTTREVHRLKAINLYQSIIDDEATEQRDRIKAQERIDKLLGLEIHSPKQIELSGPAGGPIQQQMAVVNVDLSGKLAEYAGAIRAAALANLNERVPLIGHEQPALPAKG